MHTKKLKITIGIPAYNEEANIGYLLQSLLRQKVTGSVIDKIIVNSDGSSDLTGQIVRDISDPRVRLLDDGMRKGQSVRQNEIIERTSTEVLVLLNADIKLSGDDYIQKIIKPIAEGADLVSSKVLPMPAQNFLESVFVASYVYKEDLFEGLSQGDNIYTCKGAARAMSRTFYKNFRFTKSVGEDAYTYLYCRKNNLKYKYQPECVAYIRLPNNLSDYFKQSTRFLDSKHGFANVFGADFVAKEYFMPRSHIIGSLAKNLIRHPVEMCAYLLIFSLSNLLTMIPNEKAPSDVWETAKSSKKLI